MIVAAFLCHVVAIGDDCHCICAFGGSFCWMKESERVREREREREPIIVISQWVHHQLVRVEPLIYHKQSQPKCICPFGTSISVRSIDHSTFFEAINQLPILKLIHCPIILLVKLLICILLCKRSVPRTMLIQWLQWFGHIIWYPFAIFIGTHNLIINIRCPSFVICLIEGQSWPISDNWIRQLNPMKNFTRLPFIFWLW